MIRVYRNFADAVLVALLYARDQLGDHLGNALNYAEAVWTTDQGQLYMDDKVVVAVKDSINQRRFGGTMDNPQTLTELISVLSQQITSDKIGTTYDKDLIDTVVRIVQLTYLKNRMVSSDTIKQLRAAILLPSELIGLREKLKQAELSCTNCKRELVSGEMVSFHKDGSNAIVLCINCYTPEWIPCKNGEHSIEVPDNVRKGLQKVIDTICNQCKEDNDAGPAVVGPTLAQPATLGGNAARQAARQQWFVRGAPVVTQGRAGGMYDLNVTDVPGPPPAPAQINFDELDYDEPLGREEPE